MMLSTDPEKRPSVEELLSLKPIQLRLNERKIRETYSSLKNKEEQLKQQEEALAERDSQLKHKQSELGEREEKALNLKKKLEKNLLEG